MNAAQLFSLPAAYAGHFIGWTLMALFGLIVAIRRKGLNLRVRWAAIAAFVVLLVPSIHVLAQAGLKQLAELGVIWANPMSERLGSLPSAVWLYQPVGFALLTAAIFIDRPSVSRRDPDDTP